MTNTESTGHHSPIDRELIDALANRVAVLEAKLASEGLTDAEIDELGELDADAAEQADDEPMTLRELRDERDRLDGIADELRGPNSVQFDQAVTELRAVIAKRDALTSRIRRAMAVEPTRAGERGCGARSNGSAAGFTCTRAADHEGDHVAHDEKDRAIATWPRETDEGVCPICDEVHELFFDDVREHDAARDRARAKREDAASAKPERTACAHCGWSASRCDALPAGSECCVICVHDELIDEPAKPATDRLDDEQLDRLAAAVGGALTADDDLDAMLDMTGGFVKSTAAILAIRAGMQYRADAARRAWLAVQHGKRGERWAAARERVTLLSDVLAEIDAVIAARLS